MTDDSTTPDDHTDVLHSGEAGGRVIRGAVIRTAGFGVGILFGLGTSAILLRHLGVSDYGKYGTIAALLGLVLALSDGGLSTIGARELSTAKAGEERNRKLSSLMLIRLGTTSLGVVIAVIFAAIAYSAELSLGAALVGVSVLLISMQSMATLPLLVGLRLAPVTALEVLRHVLTFAGVAALVLASAGLTAFFFVQIPIAAVLLLITLIYVRRTFNVAMRADRGEALHLARATLPLAVATTMIVLYGGVMVILVSLLTSEYETGLYVTSARVMEVVIGLPSIVTGLALPILTVANLTDRERLRSALQQMIELGLLISTLVAALIALTAPSIIALIGGPKFADAAPILAVQGIAVIGVFLNQTLQFALVSIHQQRLLIITNSIALAALVIYGLAFVSAFDAIGGAYAVIAGEATLAVLLLLTVRLSAADIQPSLRFIWKIALCAAAAMAASLVTLPSHWLNGLIGATVFAVVAIVVRAIPPELIVALAAPVMHQDRTRALLRRYYGDA